MSDSADAPTRASAVVAASTRRVLRGVAEIFWWWPGMLLVLLAYAVTAVILYDKPYPNLWGVVAAAGVGVAWYCSPVRRLESTRRMRRHERKAPPGVA